MKVGYLGPRGTFSQDAAEMYVSGREAKMIQYGNIAELIEAVYKNEIEEAVVPVENSIEGAVNVTLDKLAWDVVLKIKGEINIPITHHLMAKKGQNRKITHIFSHPQAVAQCEKFLKEHFPNASIQYTYSTAQAAEKVAGKQPDDNNGQWAAIAARKAAQEYGLEIVYQSIQDYDNNMTRFIVLSHKDAEKAGREHHCKYKTSIIFSTDNKPGSLYRILQILNLWDINMTRIESRPAKNNLGSYIFFVDFEGHREDDDIKDALIMIKKKTSFFKMLGSYRECPKASS